MTREVPGPKSSLPRQSWLDLAHLYRLQRRGLRAGPNVRIARSVEVHQAARVLLGQGVEIRRNSTLDARSSHETAISLGPECRVKENVWLAAYDGTITLGSNVLIGRNNVIFGHGGVNVGPLTMFGPNVTVLSSEHSVLYGPDVPAFQLQPELDRPVIVGPRSWIGAGVTILGGTEIASDVVVAAGAVVRGHLESGWVYGGVPAVQVKWLGEGHKP